MVLSKNVNHLVLTVDNDLISRGTLNTDDRVYAAPWCYITKVSLRDVDNSRKPGKLSGFEHDFSGCKALHFFLQNVFKCCQKIVICLFRLFTPSLLSYLN